MALLLDDTPLLPTEEITLSFARRGLGVQLLHPKDCTDVPVRAIGFASAAGLTPQSSLPIAALARQNALNGCPLVVLATHGPSHNKNPVPRAACHAYLQAAGAIICEDPDIWLETLVLFAAHTPPMGTKLAVVAPPGTWLAASAQALVTEYATNGARFPATIRNTPPPNTTDVVLIDHATIREQPLPQVGSTVVIPVVARAELVDATTPPVPLIGVRAAMGASLLAGRFSVRVAQLATNDEKPQLTSPDLQRFRRQLDKLGKRSGDHETKVLLAAYGVSITRQAVATTPSAATRVAKQAGYPVEMKPWGPDVPSERDGCPIERNIHSAAQVRRAFALVGKSSPLGRSSPVIVRETPPAGYEVRATIERVAPLGWMVMVYIPGREAPIAMPAPMAYDDAMEIAANLEASRARDTEPNRESLADILVRSAALVTSHDDEFEKLVLTKIVVASKPSSAVVVDAHARLRKPK